MTTGIYAILNKVNGKRYIGSSKNMKRRWCSHSSNLRLNRHRNIYLQRAWNKYGEDAFEFIVLLETTKEQLLLTEQLYLDTYWAEGLYNTDPVAGGPPTMTEETRTKLSASRKGKKASDETRAKQSAAQKGKKLTEETRAKLSTSLKGKEFSKETRAKMSVAQKKRPPESEETRAKKSAATKEQHLKKRQEQNMANE